MPVYWLDERYVFPDPSLADSSGLLAVGGDLSVERLLAAYRMGIFPWYDEAESPILWHAPTERFVITPDLFRFGRTIKKLVNRHEYSLTYDHAYDEVLEACAQVPRPGQDGTWLGAEMKHAYAKLHRCGHAHSAEAYSRDGRLVGGLYGVTIGSTFYGESMFSREPGASKVVFATLVPKLFELGYTLIDCQIHTEHLERFGAQMISAHHFRHALSQSTRQTLAVSWPRVSI